MDKLESKKTVSATVINEDGEILLLKRSSKKEHLPSKWNIIAGWLPDTGVSPEEHILTKIQEELSVRAHLVLGPVEWNIYRPEKGLIVKDSTFLVQLKDGGIKLDREHTEYEWISIDKLSDYDTVDFLAENLHHLGITTIQSPFKLLYKNYKGETKWRFIIPQKYYFGETDYHKGKRWLLECFDVDKDDTRTYAVEDILVWQPAVFKEL